MSATLLLIGINVIISLAGLYAAPRIIEVGMMMPYRMVRMKSWYEVITSGFVHGSLGHLFFNMFTLFFFGPVMEQVIGPVPFIFLYFSGLIASSIPTLLRHRDNPEYATLGASGAVESVLFAFILLFPMEGLYLMLIPIEIPAVLFGISFIAYSIYASKQEGKINHEAHIAGAAWGIIFMLLFIPNTVDHVMTMLGLY